MLLSAEAVTPLTERVVDWCLPAGIVIIIAGILVAAYELFIEFEVSLAAKKAAATVQNADELRKLEEGGGSIHDLLSGVTELAKALKDLHRSGQIMTIGALVLLVAALAAGLDAVGQT